ncbi:MAG: HPr family phosphocarrier protein [Nitrospirota bacterium]
MIESAAKIQNRLGLHARAAALFVRTANMFNSEVTLEKDGVEVNGKSIMGIMMLAAAKGSDIVIRADGPDEGLAVEAIRNLIDAKFHEET